MPPGISKRSNPATTSKKANSRRTREDVAPGTLDALFRQSKHADSGTKPTGELALAASCRASPPRSATSNSTCDLQPLHPPLTDSEKEELVAFDLTMAFGPCVGPTRLARWRRAHRFGLKPPLRVKEILQGRKDDDPVNQSVMSKYVS